MELILEGDPLLEKRAKSFDFDNPQEDPKKLKEELFDALIKYEGMGISACQIGVDLKVFAMRFNGSAIACFNPRITHSTEQTTYISEGCLSFPGLFFPVTRAYGINCTYATFGGEVMNASFTEVSAKVFQHEYDHMLGKLYLEYASNYILRNARRKQKLWNRKKNKNGSSSG
jgi:peptide deformylase